MSNQPNDARRPTRIGPYRILDVLGEGGMGTVYRAERDDALKLQVALKVIKLGMDSREVIARFERERRALASMQHEFIAKVHDAGTTEGGQPYFVMELVEGLPITEFCDEHRLGLRERIELFQGVCRGVQHAHQKGLVHRDLKPGNILVSHGSDHAIPKIIDFGLALAIDRDRLTQSFVTVRDPVVGTPDYMAPEQAREDVEVVDTRADVYSLGVVLYELLCGEVPFTRDQLRRAGWREAQRILTSVEPGRPSARISDIDDDASDESSRFRVLRMSKAALLRELRGDLDWIVLNAIAKDPERRYGSPTELAADLQRYLDYEPVHASPPSASHRAKKFLRKYRGTVAAAALVFCMSLVALGLARSYANESKRAASEAERQRGIADENRLLAMEQARTAIDEAAKADEQERRAAAENSRFKRLSVLVQLDDAAAESAALQPAFPDKVEAMKSWLTERGDRLAAELPEVRKVLRELEVEAPVPAKASDRFLYRAMRQAESRLMQFVGVNGARTRVERDLSWAEKIEDLSAAHPGATATWAEAREALRAANGVTASRLYSATPIDLRVQVGLVPIGMNPKTGLWEFYHLRSAFDPAGDGDPRDIPIPEHRADGSIELSEASGIVFVLIPGGPSTVGSQDTDPLGKNYDERRRRDESLDTRTIAPFFLARYELTQAQWMRLSPQDDPRGLFANELLPQRTLWPVHPAESVNWVECSDLCRRHGLRLPSEVEWEVACRGGSDRPWYPGDEPADLAGHANLLDQSALEGDPSVRADSAVPFRDGYDLLAPVGSFRANPFGLHDILGNVAEWCQTTIPGYPERAVRGGSFSDAASAARSAARGGYAPSVRDIRIGLRAARDVR